MSQSNIKDRYPSDNRELITIDEAIGRLQRIIKRPEKWLYESELVKRQDASKFVLWSKVLLHLERTSSTCSNPRFSTKKLSFPRTDKF